MCRQGGYYDQAVFLSKRHGEHELVVDILIEDSKKFDDALDYIWRLEPKLAYPNMMKYARVLLEHCPRDATQIFIDYYTGNYRPKKDIVLPAPAASQGGAASAVQNLASFIPLPYRQANAAPSPGSVGNEQLALQGAEATAAREAEPPTEYAVPKARTAFSLFVDHPDEFVTFLEACLQHAILDERDKIEIYTTLFEMYLEIATTREGIDKETWEAKAKGLIDSKDVSIYPIPKKSMIVTSP